MVEEAFPPQPHEEQADERRMTSYRIGPMQPLCRPPTDPAFRFAPRLYRPAIAHFRANGFDLRPLPLGQQQPMPTVLPHKFLDSNRKFALWEADALAPKRDDGSQWLRYATAIRTGRERSLVLGSDWVLIDFATGMDFCRLVDRVAERRVYFRESELADVYFSLATDHQRMWSVTLDLLGTTQSYDMAQRDGSDVVTERAELALARVYTVGDGPALWCWVPTIWLLAAMLRAQDVVEGIDGLGLLVRQVRTARVREVVILEAALYAARATWVQALTGIVLDYGSE